LQTLERISAACLGALLAAAASGQCPTPGSWTPLDQLASPSGTVAALLEWDPDGPGPLGNQVVCGGDFAFAGSQAAANIALYDPVARTYTPIGAGFDGPVYALAQFGGELIAAGDFGASGTSAVANLARWNGTAWVALGGGVVGPVYALQDTGTSLFVGGAISQVGGIGASGLAEWDGQAWNAAALGVVAFQQNPPATVAGAVYQLQYDAGNGRLYVGGSFARAGATVLANSIACWDGNGWSALGHPARALESMTLRGNGDVVFSSSAPPSFGSQLYRWDGVSLSTLGAPEQTGFTLLAELGNGTLVGGRSDAFSVFGEFVEWNGASWQPRQGPELLGWPETLLELSAGDELLGMSQLGSGLLTLRRGTSGGYGAPADGLDGPLRGLVQDGDGALLCGEFTQIGSTPVAQVGRYEAGVWTQIGTGLAGQLRDVCRVPGRGVAVGGYLEVGGPSPFESVMLWDGTQWQALGCPLEVAAGVEVASDGDLLAFGQMLVGGERVARWDGAAWTLLPQLPSSVVWPEDVFELANGDLIAMTSFGSHFWRWDGSGWTPLSGLGGGAFAFATSLLALPNGDLLAGGLFTLNNQTEVLVRYDGSSWSAVPGVPQSVVSDLDLLPGGRVLVSQRTVDLSGAPIASPSVLDPGSGAVTLLPGIAATGVTDIQAVVLPSGECLLGGALASVQAQVSGGFTSYLPGCPAGATQVGAGCGTVAMRIENRAWIGDPFVSRTTGIASSAIAVQVFGAAGTTLPLANAIPQAGPGCTLHAQADVLWLAVPSNGELATTWTVPNVPGLLQSTFVHQVVPFELSANGTIAAVRASDAFQLTIGVW